MKNIIICISLLFLITSCTNNKKQYSLSNNEAPYVIMLSMDGFRWDYPSKANTPNLDKIEKKGVKAEAIIPCFPTKTFPNHYSMATGLYPDNHGIILNRFYAPDLQKQYSIGNREAVENPDFYFGEPIWVTAEKQNIKTASFFWVGSETSHDGIFPTYYHKYDGSIPFESRIDSVINWLQMPEEKRPHLILWYMNEPDSKGHDVGPDNPEIINVVEYLDSLVGVFANKIAKLPHAHKINIIITSDHGMGSISKEKSVYLSDHIKENWYKHIDGGNPVYSIGANELYYDSIYNALNNIEHVKIWKKDWVPAHLNYGKNQRIKDFVLVADSSWSIWENPEDISYTGGAHGYENTNTDMHAIFYAYGPDFKSNYIHPKINNVDLYPLICKILKIKPQKTDGEKNNIKGLLK